jgi:predicted nuclease of predicted toxin-antitoxin system
MQLNDYVYWIDANLPPQTVEWLKDTFNVQAEHVFSMNLLSAEDHEIFQLAKISKNNIIVVTKDEDFIELVLKKKTPPKIIWITAGNLSNKQLKSLLLDNFKTAVITLQNPHEHFVEIS